MPDVLVPRAELLRMEDERDAALLEVERLTRLVAEVEAAHEATKAVVGRCVGKMEALEDQLGDARLDAEGHRREVEAERKLRLGFEQAHMSRVGELVRANTTITRLRTDVAALEEAATNLIDQREKLLNERNAAREDIALLRDLTKRDDFLDDPGATHYGRCYLEHAACLAHQVRRILSGAK